MEKARLSILVARIKSQVETIEKLFAKVEERKEPKSSAEWESLAFRLYNLYCGFEDLFKKNEGARGGCNPPQFIEGIHGPPRGIMA
ncbi:hypothetical protein [Ammonifex thiophilus]|uniref:Uncharacterized protein n=1 Tax=Ammonifex thiophilus TaxID=444093 RepID=A0A3D8P645_9THEO|nr:hypothetical protein [Ammonifex thiophilus]RDV84796.1 hypothetical protein DXX99_01775 [Ammonifex thiophilus]